MQLFIKQGVENTSTAQICKEVGIASGTLFVHFQTKQELIDTIYLEKKREALEVFRKTVDESKSVQENILNVSEKVVNYYVENFDDFLFLQILEKSPQVSAPTLSAIEKEREVCNRLIEKWKASKELKPIDTSLIVFIWWGILSAFIRNLSERGKTKVNKKQLELIWHAMKRY